MKNLPLPLSDSSASFQPIVVKVRESGERYFVEMELNEPTYTALLSACCEELELELEPSDKVRIYKLPDVLVRKNKDVGRLKDGQKLEVEVIKS